MVVEQIGECTDARWCDVELVRGRKHEHVGRYFSWYSRAGDVFIVLKRKRHLSEMRTGTGTGTKEALGSAERMRK
jgi:excinuclease UvrABC nuclease subunit